MSLNPQTKILVDEILSLNATPSYEMEVDEVRRVSDETHKLSGQPEPVEKVENRKIPGLHSDILIRIYTPKGTGIFPALIYFRGSGFIHGGIDSQDVLCRALTNATQCKVIAVQYRSAPEHKYPAGLNDAYAATKWLIDHAKELNIHPEKIAISGYSSGGNFATLTALRLRDEGIKLAYQVLICPCLDLTASLPSQKEFAEGYLLDAKTIEWFLNHYLSQSDDRKDPKISPLFETNLKGLPPTLMITAGCDPLRDEGKQYADNLRHAGVKVKYSCYAGQIHDLLVFRGRLDQEENPVDEIGEVLRKEFGNLK